MTDDQARAEAEARLIQSCVIRRRGVDTFDPDDGMTPAAGALVYTGPCQLGRPGSMAKSMAGADDRMVEARPLRLPECATGIRVTDVATLDGATYVVVRPDDRAAAQVTLRTVQVVATVDAEAVPT